MPYISGDMYALVNGFRIPLVIGNLGLQLSGINALALLVFVSYSETSTINRVDVESLTSETECLIELRLKNEYGFCL